MTPKNESLLIGVVGPCGSGKTTLVKGLKDCGIVVRHIAQEHSYVKDMWKRITNPDILIYLDVSYAEATRRRRLNWTQAEFDEQIRRLSHAREHADLMIFTDPLTPLTLVQKVLDYLATHPTNSAE